MIVGTMKSLEQQLKEQGLARVKADPTGKEWGECESCEFETVLVKETGMCGPCTFGEAETINGNF